MNLNNLANIATIIEAIFVIVSVVFIWRELRENTKLARTANTQSLVELSSPFNIQLIQDRQMAEFWVLGSERYDNMDVVDQYRHKSLLIWWLILHENIFYQKQNDLLDSAIYAAWASDLKDFVKQQNLARFWNELKESLQSEFAEHVTGLIEEQTTDLR